MVVEAVDGWALLPLEVAAAPPVEVVGLVTLGLMLLGLPVPAMLKRDHAVAQWPQVVWMTLVAARWPALRP